MDEKKDLDKTDFTTFRDLHEFRRMPCGLSNSTVLVLKLMSVVLQGYSDLILRIWMALSYLVQHLRSMCTTLTWFYQTRSAKRWSYYNVEYSYLCDSGQVIHSHAFILSSLHSKLFSNRGSNTIVHKNVHFKWTYTHQHDFE